MRTLVLIVAAAVLGACSRCSPSRATAPDAAAVGSPGGAFAPTDLRTALFTIFPEFRYAHLTGGEASLERRLRWKAPAGQALPEALAPYLEPKGFAPSDAGALARRPPFELEARTEGDETVLLVRLPIANDDVGRLLQTPSPMTSDHLGTYVPEPAGAGLASDTFHLRVDYQARENHAALLVRQMLDLLLAGGWRAVGPFPAGWEEGRREDGGFGAVPESFELEVENPQNRARVRAARRLDKVRVTYTQRVR